MINLVEYYVTIRYKEGYFTDPTLERNHETCCHFKDGMKPADFQKMFNPLGKVLSLYKVVKENFLHNIVKKELVEVKDCNINVQ